MTAILAYKTLSGTKNFRKALHLTVQFLALCLGSMGIWAALKFHNERGIDNFYSLHSWLGLACLLLFAIQVLHWLLQPLLPFLSLFLQVVVPCTVATWVLHLLVSWRLKKWKSFVTSMARVFGVIHLFSCDRHNCFWLLRKGHLSSKQ